MTAHIPLERLSAAFLAGLLHLAHVSSAPEPFLAAAEDALGTSPALGEEARQVAAARWEMCGLAAQRVSAWMSQVSAAWRVGSWADPPDRR
jgi:hypothetical protein